LSFSG